MDVKWLFFDIGNTIYDETEADKDRVETLLSNVDYDVTAEIFYDENYANKSKQYKVKDKEGKLIKEEIKNSKKNS